MARLRSQPGYLQILYEDEDCVAVNKPAGLAVAPGRAEACCLLELLGRQLQLPFQGRVDPRLRLVHRIDKETSGVLLLAKNRAAQQHFSHQFQNNRAGKEYLALVAGNPPGPSGQIDSPLGPDPSDPRRWTVRRDGRPALTLWQVQRRFRGWTLLRVWPKTGRTHQIRVHLKSIGLPLAVDELYNPPQADRMPGLWLSDFKRGYRRSARRQERPLIARLTLHAERLSLQATSGQMFTITAPLPRDFRAALNMLSKYASG